MFKSTAILEEFDAVVVVAIAVIIARFNTDESGGNRKVSFAQLIKAILFCVSDLRKL